MDRNNRRSLAKEVAFGVKCLHFALGFIIIASSGIYLYTLSQSSSKGYEFRQKELEFAEQENINEKLKVQTLEAKSFDELENSRKFKKMFKPEAIEFIESRLNRLTKLN